MRCVVAAVALQVKSFPLFCVATGIIGVYNAVGLQYRFAAAEVAAPQHRAMAISLVLAGGVVGGFIGPQSARVGRDLFATPFQGSFLMLVLFALVALAVQSQVHVPRPVHDAAAGKGRPLAEIARSPLILIRTDMDQEEVAQTFQKYHMASAPVVDESGRLTGMVTVDDIVDVISEEGEEDLLKLAGVSEAAQTDTVAKSVRARAPWLLVNLVAASIAGAVVLSRQDVISRLVLITAYMPIVAGMAGNAGTQALAVTVRGLALGVIPRSDMMRVVGKEMLTGMTNGLVIALLVTVVALILGHGVKLGLVVFLAMTANLVVAGFLGAFVPILLERFGVDPAVASSIFVTPLTDVCGFSLLLGLASAMLL